MSDFNMISRDPDVVAEVLRQWPKPEECDSCGFGTAELHVVDAYARTPGHGPFTPAEQKQWTWQCTLCYSTMVGNAYRYPRQYEESVREIGAILNFGFNTVLVAIKELKS